MDAVLQKVTTCGEDLDIENGFVFVFTFHFAQIGCLPVQQQVFKELLSVRAADFRLEVAAAGGLEPVVRRAAGG